MIWFTADTHFGHAAVLKHCGRPFATIEEHDEALITKWNGVVEKGDTVYHCGDFAWHSVHEYRSRLRGQIHLVLGNHDRLKAEQRALFCSVSDIKKVKIDDQKIYLCHYAMRVWNCSHHGSWHLFGHSHGSLTPAPNSRSMDVGVDCHNFRPVSYDEIEPRLTDVQWFPVDHHGTNDESDTTQL